MSQANAPPRSRWNIRLYDGSDVWVRPISKEDDELELEFLKSLSPKFRKLRFLGLVRDPDPEVARELTDLDPVRAMGFIALAPQEGRDHQIGAAHFHTNVKGDSCDCSVTVSDEWQKRGVGSSLMRLLIEAARARGVRNMVSYAPAQSEGSRRLASHLGFERRQDYHDPATVVYHLELE